MSTQVAAAPFAGARPTSCDTTFVITVCIHDALIDVSASGSDAAVVGTCPTSCDTHIRYYRLHPQRTHRYLHKCSSGTFVIGADPTSRDTAFIIALCVYNAFVDVIACCPIAQIASITGARKGASGILAAGIGVLIICFSAALIHIFTSLTITGIT